jgi:hypothetical protein
MFDIFADTCITMCRPFKNHCALQNKTTKESNILAVGNKGQSGL